MSARHIYGPLWRRLRLRWWVFVLAALVGGVLWLQFCFSVQVNAAIRAQAASAEVQRNTLGAIRPPSLTQKDYWERPFLYLTSADCFVVVSFGSDGKPDENYDLSVCKWPTGRYAPRTSCIWPTMDTVYINGLPAKACGK